MREEVEWFVEVESDIVGRLSISLEVKPGVVCSVHGVDDTVVSSYGASLSNYLCLCAPDCSAYTMCSMM